MSRTAERTANTSAPAVSPATAVGGRRIRLIVLKDGRERQTVEFVAASEPDAIRQAAAKGWQVIDIEAPAQAAASMPAGGKTRFPLLLFSQEMLALLEAGLNLTEALATLHAKQPRGAVQDILADVLRALREGLSYSDVLAAHPQHFPDVYVATVKAAERTGDLPQALARYIAYQLQFDVLKVGSSRVDLQACKLEYSIVSPK